VKRKTPALKFKYGHGQCQRCGKEMAAQVEALCCACRYGPLRDPVPHEPDAVEGLRRSVSERLREGFSRLTRD
jgi:ribosomal protein L37E